MKRLPILTVLLLLQLTFYAQSIFQNQIHFASDQYVLDNEASAVLDDLMMSLEGIDDIAIEIIGHTDQDGSEAYNLVLSQKRAEEVKQYLEKMGISPSDIELAYKGETDLAADAMDSNSKHLNRRVSIRTTAYDYKNVEEMVSQVVTEELDEFVIDDKVETNLELSKGTSVKIPVEAFCHLDGSPIGEGNIDLVLKEAFDYLDMVDQGLYTQTEDQILETGGMIFIGASQNGKELRLREGKQIELRLPAQEELEEGMELFTGVRDGQATIWQETGEEVQTRVERRNTPFIEVDLSPLTNIEVEEMNLPSLDFGQMRPYPRLRMKPNPPYEGNYSEEGYKEAITLYENAMADYNQAKKDQPEKMRRWLNEAKRRKEILFEHKKQYVLSTVRNKVIQNLARLKKDQTRISHERLVEVLFSFLGKAVGRVEYDEWFHIRKTFGNQTVYVKKELGLDFPMYSKMPSHYFFSELDSAIKAIRQEVAEKKYEMGYIDASVLSSYVVSTSQLNWINVDKYYNLSADQRMDLEFASFQKTDQIYLIFKDNKSLIRPLLTERGALFKGVPRGEGVRLVAVKMTDGTAQMAQLDFTTGEANPGNIEFVNVDVKELKRAIHEI